MADKVINKRQCPLCRDEGRDTDEDNLWEYSNGILYCQAGHGTIGFKEQRTRFIKAYDKRVNHETIPKIDDGIYKYVYEIPPHARAFLYNFNFIDTIINRFFIQYIEDGWWCSSTGKYVKIKDALFMPVIENKKIAGYVTKVLDKTKSKIKSIKSKECPILWTRDYILTRSKTLVITEDNLSCYRIANTFNDAVSLMGVKLTVKNKLRLAEILRTGYEHVYLWLDDDQGGDIGRLSLCEWLRMRCRHLHVVYADEPKHLTDTQISEILEDEKEHK